jgi:hypothetical protein
LFELLFGKSLFLNQVHDELVFLRVVESDLVLIDVLSVHDETHVLVVVIKGRLQAFFLVAPDQSIVNRLSKRHMIHTSYVLVVGKYCILIFLHMYGVNEGVESLLRGLTLLRVLVFLFVDLDETGRFVFGGLLGLWALLQSTGDEGD